MTTEFDQARGHFNAHIMEKAAAARARHGPGIDADAVLAMLDDRTVVRYPTSIVFDAGPLQPHEFAWPRPIGFHPADGYCLFVHPRFQQRRASWPLLIPYHIPSINYGAAAEAEQAELFAATLLGLGVEAYYEKLCAEIDAMPRSP